MGHNEVILLEGLKRLRKEHSGFLSMRHPIIECVPNYNDSSASFDSLSEEEAVELLSDDSERVYRVLKGKGFPEVTSQQWKAIFDLYLAEKQRTNPTMFNGHIDFWPEDYMVLDIDGSWHYYEKLARCQAKTTKGTQCKHQAEPINHHNIDSALHRSIPPTSISRREWYNWYCPIHS